MGEKENRVGPSRAGLALNLLVLRIGLADHAYLALAADDLATAADSLDACLDLHGSNPWRLGRLLSPVTRNDWIARTAGRQMKTAQPGAAEMVGTYPRDVIHSPAAEAPGLHIFDEYSAPGQLLPGPGR
jgi:hypothetical protein